MRHYSILRESGTNETLLACTTWQGGISEKTMLAGNTLSNLDSLTCRIGPLTHSQSFVSNFFRRPIFGPNSALVINM